MVKIRNSIPGNKREMFNIEKEPSRAEVINISIVRK
jgi:hypothetical protein